MNAWVCIASEEYLPYYKILYESLKRYSPGTKQLLYFIGDNVPTEFDEVVDITEWKTIYTDKLAHICSLRPKVILDAFARGYKRIGFTGADLEFFEDVENLFDRLCGVSALYSPHITEPLPEDGKFPSNESIAKSGYINSDFIMYNMKNPNSVHFLKWQAKYLETKCITSSGNFLDQTSLNFLPFYAQDSESLPRYHNCAYWNTTDEDFNTYFTGYGSLLASFQYSGLPLDNPGKISVHQNRETATGRFLEFLQSYADRVKANKFHYDLKKKLNE